MDETVESIEQRLRDSGRPEEPVVTGEPLSLPSPELKEQETPQDVLPPAYAPWQDRPPRSWALRPIIWVLFVLAVLAAFLIGFLMRLRPESYSKREVMYASFLGILLMRALQCVSIPLFVLSIISAIGHLNFASSAKLALQSLIFIFVTTAIAAIIGCILVAAIHPGSRLDKMSKMNPVPWKEKTVVDAYLDLIRNLIPFNIYEAFVFSHTTELETPRPIGVPLLSVDFETEILEHRPNYMGLLIIALVFGFTIAYIGPVTHFFLYVIDGLTAVFLDITLWIIIVSPVGAFCLVLGEILAIDGVAFELQQLGLYVITVLAGLLLHTIVILLVLYIIMVRRFPIQFIYHCFHPLIFAFATSSCLASLPTTLLHLEHKSDFNPRITRVVVPLGVVINMSGTALYITVALIFLGQRCKRALGIDYYLIATCTGVLASFGVCGLPYSGMIQLMAVTNALGVPTEYIGVFMILDWILGRFAAFTDLWSTCVLTAIMNSRRKNLDVEDDEDEDKDENETKI